MRLKRHVLALVLAGITTPATVWATNGMNMEGYGPIATGMGGASFAYDNGTAAVMNNPATLGLMGKGSRLDVALGFLGPDVTSTHMGTPMSSGGDAYYMPAVGYVRSDGKLTYGFGLFAQGGMGTEYNMGVDGGPERSELGVGRLIAPLAYQVSDELVIGGSLDFVWAMLDLRMALPGGMGFLTTSGLISGGTGILGGTATSGAFDGLTSMRLDFSDSNDFTGKAKGSGFAGKLGFTYKISPAVMVGGSYHSKTALSNLKTGSNGTSLVAVNPGGAFGMGEPPGTYTETGKIIVRDFEWPETFGVGIAVQASPYVLVAADVKRIGWKDVMKNFKMTYESGGGLGFTGSVDFTLPQNWDNQTVFSLGLAYKATDALTLRAGANLADNPIPDSTLNYLFPAIVENHYTLGFGYDFSKVSALNFSLTYAPEVSQTNTTMGYKVEHSQTNWQLMYTHRF